MSPRGRFGGRFVISPPPKRCYNRRTLNNVLTVGENFLRYKIISLIGSGGMGEVYLARDRQLERNVAIKILRPKLSHRSGDSLERFILEARSASALNHPNIITIHEIGEAD